MPGGLIKTILDARVKPVPSVTESLHEQDPLQVHKCKTICACLASSQYFTGLVESETRTQAKPAGAR